MSSHSYHLRPRPSNKMHERSEAEHSEDEHSEDERSETEHSETSDDDYDPMMPETSDEESEAESDTSETDTSESETDASEASEAESDAEADIAQLGRSYRITGFVVPPASRQMAIVASRSLPVAKKNPWLEKLSPEEKNYLKGLSPQETSQLLETYKTLVQQSHDAAVPLRFKLLALPPTALPDASKRLLMQKLEHYQSMTPDHTDYAKYTQWVQSLNQIPFGRFHTLPPEASIADTLGRMQQQLDDTVFGHTETKHQLLMLMAQWLANPSAKGRCIGIQGPMGIGKTTLIKDGVSRALGFPFAFIALGGSADGAFLEGHSFTYEGAVYGRIVEQLMRHQVMNPILFFDELDKVSASPKGDEVSAILTHLTDPTQNSVFTDKYFGSVELDVSRCLMVFSFNDIDSIHPILRDRLTVIHAHGYTAEEKQVIARRHLLPRLNRDYHFPEAPGEGLVLPDATLRALLGRCPDERGIRRFIQALERVYGWVNMARYVVSPPFTECLAFPFVVEPDHLEVFLKTSAEDGANRAPFSMYS